MPLPRDARWLNPASPQIPATAIDLCSSSSLPRSLREGFRQCGEPHASKSKRRRPFAGRTLERQWCADLSMLLGREGKRRRVLGENRLVPWKTTRAPTGFERFIAFVIARTSQDCGSSAAFKVEKFPEAGSAATSPRNGPGTRSEGPGRAPPRQTFFQVFYHVHRVANFYLRAKPWKARGFLRTAQAIWACDDLLTMAVDNPEGWGL